MNKLAPFPLNKQFGDWFVGIDRIFDQLDQSELLSKQFTSASSYPPYNIVSTEKDKYTIDLAVAGFADNEIEITLEDRKLTVNGKKETNESNNSIIVRGIAGRSFSRSFVLADQVKVDEAELSDGILSINLHQDIPEEKKPTKIKIGAGSKEFLSEST